MGYSTYYSGQIDIKPPLTKPEYLRLAQVISFWNSEDIIKAASSDVFNPELPALTADDKTIQEAARSVYGLSFNLTPDAIIDVQDRIKGYGNEDTFPLLARWLEQNGHTWEGVIGWDGDDTGDTGEIYAATVDGKNVIESVPDEHTNPGPSWKKAVTV